MDKFTNTTAYYYTIITILAITFCTVLLAILDWPVLAEIPLAICIFVQLIAISRSLYNSWSSHQEDVFEDLIISVKSQFLGVEAQDEEVKLWESKKAS